METRDYPIEFKYKFRRCGLLIPASSIEEAEEMLEAIKQNGEVVGGPIELEIKVPESSVGILKKLSSLFRC